MTQLGGDDEEALDIGFLVGDGGLCWFRPEEVPVHPLHWRTFLPRDISGPLPPPANEP